MNRLVVVAIVAFSLSSFAAAQTAPPPLGEQAKRLIGAWEFSNAERDRRCTATFKAERAAAGYKVEFDKGCLALFPLVANVAGWVYPENDLLNFLDAQGKALVEFSEVEDGIYEAPTPGVGVLFLQNAAVPAPPPRAPVELTGDWGVVRAGTIVCSLTLTPELVKDVFALTVKPGCDPAIARLGFVQWRAERGELTLTPSRGNAWRFEQDDNGTWKQIAEGDDRVVLVRQ